MSIEIRPAPLGGSELVRRYLDGEPSALGWFAQPPFRIAVYRRRAARLADGFGRERRQRAAAALRPTSARARDRLQRFVEQGGAVVTTGQQAGLFCGPLFTLHKALSAVRLARELEARLGTTVLPVFWVASEDHDWAEVDHVHVTDGRDVLRRLHAPDPDERPLPMSERMLTRGLETTLAELAQHLTGKAYAAEVMERVREAYRPGRTVAGAFGSLIAELLAPFDVLLTDAADPALKQASLPVLRVALEQAEAQETALRATAGELLGAGFTPQVALLDAAANLFLRTERGRERLYRDPRGWITHETRQVHPRDALLGLLEREPGRFSPNVLLRPVVESSVFPVLAYVAGPGEIAYFGQLRGLFEQCGVEMPVVHPRSSLLLVEPRIRALLSRLDLSAAELTRPAHELIARHSRSMMPAAVEAALADLRSAVVAGFDRVGAEAAGVDATLVGAAGGRRNRALLEVAALERKLLRALTRREQAWAKDLGRVRSHLAPLGSTQERVLSGLPFLAEHGPGLLERVLEEIDVAWVDEAEPAVVGPPPAL